MCHCEPFGEAIQPIEKTGLGKSERGLIHVTNLFPCLGFAPRSQSIACCAYAQAGSICSLSGFAHFVRAIRPQIRYSLIPLKRGNVGNLTLPYFEILLIT